MADFGGRIRFTFNGNPLVLRGKVDIEPCDTSYEAIVNQDGSVSRSAKPKGVKWSATFEDTDDATVSQATGQDRASIMKGGPYNITIPEDDTGVLHTFTGCLMVGDVKIDRMNGEVTGIEGISPTGGYKRTTTS